MTKAFKPRQIGFFYIALMPVVKFFMMPSMLSDICGEDLWISALINCIIDLATISALYFCLKDEDCDFFSLLEQKFGKFFAKTVMVFYLIFFLLKTVLPLNEEKDYVELTLYMTSPNLTTFMPIFFAIFFICLKKSRVIGRIADGVFIIAVIGYAFMFALSVPNTDIAAILPVGAHGIKNILSGTYSASAWFFDGAYFLFFIGNYVKGKKDGLKILLSVLVSSLTVIAFLMIFYGTFTSIAFRQRFALTEISKYTTSINNMERFDFIPIFALLFTSVLSLALPFYFACELFTRLVKVKRWIAALIVSIPSALLLVVFGEYFSSIENFIINIASGYFIFFGSVFPAFMAIFIKLKDKKEINNEICGS